MQAGQPGVEAAVELVEPMGSESVVWAKLNGEPLSIMVQGEKRMKVGEKIRVAFPGPQLNLFDTALGTRI